MRFGITLNNFILRQGKKKGRHIFVTINFGKKTYIINLFRRKL